MKVKRHVLLLSSANVYGYELLEHSRKSIENMLMQYSVKNILFVPFAQKGHDAYTQQIRDVVSKWGYNVEGLHRKANPIEAVKNAEAIYIGGGNTFLLLRTLYEKNLIDTIRDRVLSDGIPYIGSSAGTNVATCSIHTTNDMPIVYPPTFEALGLVPFNINPHYLDTDLESKHKGETRERRITEFHEYNETPVLGLREGTALLVDGDEAMLLGSFNARLFQKNKEPVEIKPNSDLTFLLKY